jgi:hypothetical protein
VLRYRTLSCAKVRYWDRHDGVMFRLLVSVIEGTQKRVRVSRGVYAHDRQVKFHT